MLKHEDLKKEGLHLSQLDAQAIQSKVTGISQGHFPDGIVYHGNSESETPKTDLLKEYHAEQQSKISELLKENAELKFKIAELTVEKPEIKGQDVTGEEDQNNDGGDDENLNDADVKEQIEPAKPKGKGGRKAKV